VFFFVSDGTGVDKSVEDVKHKLVLIVQRDFAFGSLFKGAIECAAEVVRVEGEKVFMYDVDLLLGSDFNRDVGVLEAGAENG
jgi:hypothetical protein